MAAEALMLARIKRTVFNAAGVFWGAATRG